MHHRLVPTRPDHLWTLLGIALMLCVVVTACEGEVVTPTTPTETKTQVLVTTGGGSVQVPPPIPATGGTTSIEGTFYGEMRYFVPGQRPWLGDCVAADHRISLTR